MGDLDSPVLFEMEHFLLGGVAKSGWTFGSPFVCKRMGHLAKWEHIMQISNLGVSAS
jgi:hypothetical protein